MFKWLALLYDNTIYIKDASPIIVLCLIWQIMRKGFDIMAKKVTSLRVAKQASKVLKDGRSSKRSKTIAGSALSQREKTKR